MMAAIESAEGVLNAREIAKASTRLIGIALGAEDYVTNMKTKRYPDDKNILPKTSLSRTPHDTLQTRFLQRSHLVSPNP